MGKLVRDKIPEIITKNGEIPFTRQASDQEFWQKLKEKLQEEVNEFNESESAEEVADILEVIENICVYKNFDAKTIESIKKEKAQKRGSFKKRIIFER